MKKWAFSNGATPEHQQSMCTRGVFLNYSIYIIDSLRLIVIQFSGNHNLRPRNNTVVCCYMAAKEKFSSQLTARFVGRRSEQRSITLFF